MIKTVADLLMDLVEIEAKNIARQRITHGPTIGAMYEGLARDIVDRTLPSNFDLRVVDGFVKGIGGRISPQMDAMLVKGAGEAIPHTASYVWPISDVVAVFEVKKNLFGDDLKDAFSKLLAIKNIHRDYVSHEGGKKYDIRSTFKAFALLTGTYPESWSAADNLPDELSIIFHTLVMGQVGPIRVILGYEGYSDEISLRKGMAQYLEDNVLVRKGFGAGSFPNLIICRNNSLVKMNGLPYSFPLVDGHWHILTSNNENPVRILIEMIWTKLSNLFAREFPMTDTLQMERLAPFLSGRVVTHEELQGWEYRVQDLTRKQIASFAPRSWTPESVDDHEHLVLLLAAKTGTLDLRDKALTHYFACNSLNGDMLIDNLIERRLLARINEHNVRLIGDEVITGFTPEGMTFAAVDADLLQLWITQIMAKNPEK